MIKTKQFLWPTLVGTLATASLLVALTGCTDRSKESDMGRTTEQERSRSGETAVTPGQQPGSMASPAAPGGYSGTESSTR